VSGCPVVAVVVVVVVVVASVEFVVLVGFVVSSVVEPVADIEPPPSVVPLCELPVVGVSPVLLEGSPVVTLVPVPDTVPDAVLPPSSPQPAASTHAHDP
jgi:hypothetical protein